MQKKRYSRKNLTTQSCGTSSSGSSAKISVQSIQLIIEKLKCQQNRQSTNKTYIRVWRQFNKFLMQLDYMPRDWENRTSLFIAHLVEKGMQSSTVKSYVSAIKRNLVDDNYPWNDNKVLLGSLTRACKITNDIVLTRLPIQCGLLELVLFELERMFGHAQLYLEIMYKALFSLGYYGLMRVGELTVNEGGHTVKAGDIHLALNKEKLLVVLYTSKTHGLESRPQHIKIVSNKAEKSGRYLHRNFCPFSLIQNYIHIREGYTDEREPFFIFKGGKPVGAQQARQTLKEAIKRLSLDEHLYDMHSLRIGRASDLAKFGYSVEEIKRMGRWRSNAVYRYIRNC